MLRSIAAAGLGILFAISACDATPTEEEIDPGPIGATLEADAEIASDGAVQLTGTVDIAFSPGDVERRYTVDSIRLITPGEPAWTIEVDPFGEVVVPPRPADRVHRTAPRWQRGDRHGGRHGAGLARQRVERPAGPALGGAVVHGHHALAGLDHR